MSTYTFTSVKTWAPGDVMTAADMNSYVKNNVGFLADPPRCRVYRSSNQSISDATDTAISFDNERKDTDTMWAAGSPTRITLTTAGMYDIGACDQWASNTTAARKLWLRSSEPASIVYSVDNPTYAINFAMTVSTIYEFTAAQYFEVMVNQNSGGALNIQYAAKYSPEAWANWLGE